MPLVSVIITTYNRAGLLPKAIESVLAQTFQDFELIVVDDGSTDQTRQVVEAYRDARIRYLYQSNRGVSGALNTGFAAAQSEFITQLDSDDCWEPELLATLLPEFEGHPELGVVYARVQAMDDEGRPLAPILGAPGHYPGQVLASLLYGNFICTIAAILRKDCYLQVGRLDESLNGIEDLDIWIRLAQITQFKFVNQVLAHYRVHTGRSTAKTSKSFATVVQRRFDLLNKVFSQPNLPPEALAVKPLAYRNAHLDTALRWKSARQYRKMFSHFAQAVRVSPNRLATVGRIVFLILFYDVFSRYPATLRWVERLTAWRRKGRRRL